MFQSESRVSWEDDGEDSNVESIKDCLLDVVDVGGLRGFLCI